MSNKILTHDQLPPMEAPQEGAIVAYIVSDNDLMFENGAAVNCSPTEVQALNILLSNRNQALTVQQMQAEADTGTSLSVLARQVGTLAARLFDAAIKPVDPSEPEAYHEAASHIKVVEVDESDGLVHATYQLAPEFTLVDRRETFDSESQSTIERLKNLVKFKEVNRPDTRTEVIGEAVRLFSGHPTIRRRMKELYVDYVIPVQQLRMPSAGKGEPTPDECEEAFLKIEQGIAAIFEEKDLAKATEACLGMVDTYHTMYHRYLHMASVISLAKHHRLRPYSETFPEACVALFEQFAKSYASYRNAVAFTENARTAILQRVTMFINFDNDNVLPLAAEQKLHEIATAQRTYAQKNGGQQPTFDEIGAIVGLSKAEVVKLLADPRRRRTPAEPDFVQAEPSIASELEQFTIQDQVHDILHKDILSLRQKMIVSLYFGIFIKPLAGSRFFSGGQYTYPQDLELMPKGPLSELRISELLDVPLHAVQQMFQAGLKEAGIHLKSQGYETADEVY